MEGILRREAEVRARPGAEHLVRREAAGEVAQVAHRDAALGPRRREVEQVEEGEHAVGLRRHRHHEHRERDPGGPRQRGQRRPGARQRPARPAERELDRHPRHRDRGEPSQREVRVDLHPARGDQAGRHAGGQWSQAARLRQHRGEGEDEQRHHRLLEGALPVVGGRKVGKRHERRPGATRHRGQPRQQPDRRQRRDHRDRDQQPVEDVVHGDPGRRRQRGHQRVWRQRIAVGEGIQRGHRVRAQPLRPHEVHRGVVVERDAQQPGSPVDVERQRRGEQHERGRRERRATGPHCPPTRAHGKRAGGDEHEPEQHRRHHGPLWQAARQPGHAQQQRHADGRRGRPPRAAPEEPPGALSREHRGEHEAERCAIGGQHGPAVYEGPGYVTCQR